MLQPTNTRHEHAPRAPPQWRVILTRLRERRWTANEEEAHPLEAMLHWRDPHERLRTIRRRRHGLLDDNPSSG